ncbi:MAG: 30S ribosome-binding factor RbfA [Planctomycetota bacterium]|nr:MAG: 30S ribosome-binding factor RbfA [Planctomycetota bacterium]
MATERRQKQVASQIQQRIANLLLFEMNDPRLRFTTVTGVEMSADLTLARIRYSVLGDDGARSAVAAALQHAHGFIRREVAKFVRLRLAPEVVFEYDRGIEKADRIERILREVLPHDAEPPSPGAG